MSAATAPPQGPPQRPGEGPAEGAREGPGREPPRGPRHAPRSPVAEPRGRDGFVRHLPALATAAAVLGVIAVTLWQLHPSLLLQGTTTNGGDMGSHVMMPRTLQTLLSHGHLTGWSPQWYAGYPIYTFYFVLPDLLAALAGKVIAYNIAFKLATVLGSLALPVAVWAAARLFGLRRPVPGMLAVAALPFLFDYTYTIYGGNLFSTLAGEYAFSLGLSLALVFLGLFARALRTGQHRAWAAVVLALCVLSHVIATMFAVAGALILTLLALLPARIVPHEDLLFGDDRPDARIAKLGRGRMLWVAASTVGVGLLLSGWWLVPFGARTAYTNSMNYVNVHTFWALLLPGADAWALVMAALGAAAALVLRSRFGLLFSLLGGAAALAVIHDPQGSLYNTRLVPLWFVCVYLMAGWTFAAFVVLVARWVRREPFLVRVPPPVELAPLPSDPDPPPLPRFPLTPVAALDAWFGVSGLTPAVGPSSGAEGPGPSAPAASASTPDASTASAPAASAPTPNAPAAREPLPGEPAHAARRPRWGPAVLTGPLIALAAACLVVVPPFFVPARLLPVTPGPNLVSNWAHYNYSGYESQPSWPEYHAVLTAMSGVGSHYGCGRAMWEYNADLDRFGTPQALMLLPYWTKGCIDSMEGLLFESSATTPYHFLNQAELSVAPSEPMVGLPYGPVDVALGVRHLQLLGVRYFMAFSPEIEKAALADPSLQLVAQTGPWLGQYQTQSLSTTWDVFLVKDAPLVQALPDLPAVLRDVSPRQSSWLNPSIAWYQNPANFDVELAQDGPPDWPRVGAGEAPPAVPAPRAVVSGVRQTSSSVSFHVSRPGTPVLVKVSYFPNWRATGAAGPYRVTPNLMVVVPSANEVTLTYGSTPVNWVGEGCTVVGAGALLVLWAGRVRRPRRVARP